MEKIRKMFTSKSSRNGTYSVGLAVIVIAIAIVINLVAGQLPENVRNIKIIPAFSLSLIIPKKMPVVYVLCDFLLIIHGNRFAPTGWIPFLNLILSKI